MAVEGHDYRISFIEDPDGYRVELVERGTMKVGDLIQ
jgi:lactoylglutathione lyase